MRSIKRNARRAAAATVASGLLAAGALALTTSAASASTTSHQGATAYSFRTIDNPKDLTFNQLLGINDEGQIVGYFGSGAQGAPNKGYTIPPSAGHFSNENFPHSVQTQVTGLNNRGVTVGFWSSMNNANQVNDNFGFVDVNGHFRNADFPTSSPATRRSTSCSASTTTTSRSASTPTPTATTTATSTTLARTGSAR